MSEAQSAEANPSEEELFSKLQKAQAELNQLDEQIRSKDPVYTQLLTAFNAASWSNYTSPYTIGNSDIAKTAENQLIDYIARNHPELSRLRAKVTMLRNEYDRKSLDT